MQNFNNFARNGQKRLCVKDQQQQQPQEKKRIEEKQIVA